MSLKLLRSIFIKLISYFARDAIRKLKSLSRRDSHIVILSICVYLDPLTLPPITNLLMLLIAIACNDTFAEIFLRGKPYNLLTV